MNKRIRNIWYCMKRRCHNPAPSDFENGIAKNYFEKGIQVCDEWKDNFSAFEKWALSNGYKDNLVIDRINSNGNYEPGNCRWITQSENAARIDRKRKQCTEIRRSTRKGNYEVWKIGMGNWARVKAVELMYSDAIKVRNQLSNKETGKNKGLFRVVKVGKNRHKINEFLLSI